MALKSVSTGLFTIPTAPSPGTSVAQSASANTYGSYIEAIASTAAALFITAIQISASSASTPKYVNIQIGTGGAGAETIVGQVQATTGSLFTAGTSEIGSIILLQPWIAVPISTRIALAAASDAASAIAWNVSLQCIAQADVVDAGISESAAVVTNADKTGYALSASQTFDLTGDITGNISGSVGSVTGSVFSVRSPVVTVSVRGRPGG